MMRRIARIARRQRAVHDFAQLLDEGDTHGHHSAPRAKRWNHGVTLFQRQASAHSDSFLATARKNLRRHFAFVLPTNAGVFEQASDEHMGIEAPFEGGVSVHYLLLCACVTFAPILALPPTRGKNWLFLLSLAVFCIFYLRPRFRGELKRGWFLIRRARCRIHNA